jgi:hypothetical protein
MFIHVTDGSGMGRNCVQSLDCPLGLAAHPQSREDYMLWSDAGQGLLNARPMSVGGLGLGPVFGCCPACVCLLLISTSYDLSWLGFSLLA